MRIDLVGARVLLACALGMASLGALAQTPIGPTELAQAKTLLDLSRAQLSAEQFALLSQRLAATESAYAELATVARTSQAVVAATEGGAAASVNATATGGRAVLSGVAELLPFLLLVWPATAHAPGVTQETPEVRAARSKVEERLKELAEAARQVQAERAAAASRVPKPSPERCLQSCEGGPEKTPEQRKSRLQCWAAIEQSPQYCRNTCYSILGR